MKEVLRPAALPECPGIFCSSCEISKEVVMIAYLLVLLGVATRYLVAGHLPLLNFTAVTGSLLYFGARRSWREMLGPVAIFMLSDYALTTYVYHYAFHWQAYVTTWAWYAAAIALGQILLHARTTFVRGAAAAILGPTSFYIVSDYSVWASGFNGYPHTLAGFVTCYVAAIPFYRNDLASTSIVLAVALGAPILVRKMRTSFATTTPGAA
jgi:Family of unknown function (DUF6580)